MQFQVLVGERQNPGGLWVSVGEKDSVCLHPGTIEVLIMLTTRTGRVAPEFVETAHGAGDGILYGRGQCGGLQIDRVKQSLLLVEQIQQRVVRQRQTGGSRRSTARLGKLIEGHGRGRGRVSLEFIVDYGAQVAVEKVVAVGLYCRGGRHIGARQGSLLLSLR